MLTDINSQPRWPVHTDINYHFLLGFSRDIQCGRMLRNVAPKWTVAIYHEVAVAT